MTVLEVLKGARAKVAHGWTREVSARDQYGHPCEPSSPRAVCWCMNGALVAAEPDQQHFTKARMALKRAAGLPEEEVTPWLADWNDEPERTQEAIVAAFDRAIAAEEAKS